METLRIGPGVPRPPRQRSRLAEELTAAAGTAARGLLVGLGAGLGLTIWAMIGSLF